MRCQRETGDYLKTYESYFGWGISKRTVSIVDVVVAYFPYFETRVSPLCLANDDGKSCGRFEILIAWRQATTSKRSQREATDHQQSQENQSHDPPFGIRTHSDRKIGLRDIGVISKLDQLDSPGSSIVSDLLAPSDRPARSACKLLPKLLQPRIFSWGRSSNRYNLESTKRALYLIACTLVY